MGIGDWVLGVGDWGLGQSPIPDPQSPLSVFKFIEKKSHNLNIKINKNKK
jgi:hypothetical protein